MATTGGDMYAFFKWGWPMYQGVDVATCDDDPVYSEFLWSRYKVSRKMLTAADAAIEVVPLADNIDLTIPAEPPTEDVPPVGHVEAEVDWPDGGLWLPGQL